MSTTNETKGFYKLSWLQRIGFGSGDLAQNLIFQTVACYLMIYLTTVLKINPAFVLKYRLYQDLMILKS